MNKNTRLHKLFMGATAHIPIPVLSSRQAHHPTYPGIAKVQTSRVNTYKLLI